MSDYPTASEARSIVAQGGGVTVSAKELNPSELRTIADRLKGSAAMRIVDSKYLTPSDLRLIADRLNHATIMEVIGCKHLTASDKRLIEARAKRPAHVMFA